MAGDSQDRGRGISGVVDVVTVLDSTTRKFVMNCWKVATSYTAGADTRAGRGDGDYPEQAYTFSGGSVVLTGEEQLSGRFLPESFNGHTGSVVFNHGPGKTQTISVLFTGASITYDEVKDTSTLTGLTANVTTAPVFAGWDGTPVAAADPQVADKVLWEGLSKTRDSYNLQDSETYTVDLYLAEGATPNETEWAKIASVVSAASPTLSGMKKRPATLTRLTARRARITLSWLRTTTSEDVTLPLTEKSVDPAGLTSQAAAAALNGSPSDPTGDSFVVTSTSTRVINDSNTLTVKNYGLRTSKQAIEFDGTFNKIDVVDIESVGQQTSVYATSGSVTAAAVPSGLQKVGTSITVLNPTFSKVEYFYAKDTSQQRAEQEASYLSTDPEGLQTEERVALVDSTGSPQVGLYVRATKTQQLTHDHAINTIICGVRSTKQDIEMPGSVKKDDPSDLADTATSTTVTASATPPSIPSSPLAGAVHNLTESEQLHDTAWRHTFGYGPTTTKDREEFEGTVADADPNDIATEKTIRNVTGSSTAPAIPSAPTGTKHVATRSQQLTTGGKWSHTFRFAAQDSKDRVEQNGSTVVDDASDLADETTITKVQGSATPTPPTTPTGLSLTDTTTKQLSDTKWAHAFHYGLLTNKEKIEHNGTSATNDAIQNTASDTATVVTCLSSDTAISLAATAYTANRSLAAFKGVRVQKLNKLQALKIIELANDDKLVRRNIAPGRNEDMKALVGAYGNAGVFVHIAELPGPLIGGPGGYTAARLTHYEVFRTRGVVTLRRRIICANAAALANAYQFSLQNTVNNAAFLGYPAYTLMMGAASGVSSYALVGGAHLFMADYNAAYDHLCHPILSRIAVGWNTTASATTLVNLTGDVDPASYFGADKVALWPPASDWSVLLA